MHFLLASAASGEKYALQTIYSFQKCGHDVPCQESLSLTWLLVSAELCLLPCLGSFQPLFLWTFFQSFPHLLRLWWHFHVIINMTTFIFIIRSFVTVPHVSETLFIFFSAYFVHYSDWVISFVISSFSLNFFGSPPFCSLTHKSNLFYFGYCSVLGFPFLFYIFSLSLLVFHWFQLCA